jgi:quercetin dioxygenase-like cupin family protein
MVSANLRRPLVGTAAVAAMLGWLQLAPAFGYPVTAPGGMLDRVFGADREAGPLGWLFLLLGAAAFVAFFFVVVEPRTQRQIAPIAYAIGAWLFSGAVVMPLAGLLQGAPPPGALATDPMRGNFFMLNLGIGATAEALIGWLLFGAVLAAGVALKVNARSLALAVGTAGLAAVVALAAPALLTRTDSSHVFEARLPALPAGVFISVLELPQPAGAVLGPHMHVAGFVADVAGTATMMIGGGAVDVGPGDAVFTADQVPHDHENRAAVPFAIGLAVVLVGLTLALFLRRGHQITVGLTTALLVVGTVATVNPLMNHWYFIAVRPPVQRGIAMPVPAGHRTYESPALTGLPSGPYLERLTDRRLNAGESLRVVGPAAIVVIDGQASIIADGRATGLSAQSGATIAGGTEAIVQSGSGSGRVFVVQVLPAS